MTSFSQELLKYFSTIKNDSIVDTGEMHIASLCSKYDENPLPDSITLKYFFNNDTENMYYKAVDYSTDFDTWHTSIIKKTTCPFFYKKFNEYYLICYEIDYIIYLSIYDSKRDTILSSYVVCDITDENGNQVTQSIIFPNNYIASVETMWGGDVFYKLLKIDIGKNKFILIKNIKTSGEHLTDEEIYKRTYQILGINEKGELIK
jgi:hypothetical protein